jgi:hypothetical protein
MVRNVQQEAGEGDTMQSNKGAIAIKIKAVSYRDSCSSEHHLLTRSTATVG